MENRVLCRPPHRRSSIAGAMNGIELRKCHGLCVGDVTGARSVQDHLRLVVSSHCGRRIFEPNRLLFKHVAFAILEGAVTTVVSL
jgi:hypothetical protein